tara:strand:- start:118 stop:495 length:378 start_codon:yes stop_codon:yes gene_type:complete
MQYDRFMDSSLMPPQQHSQLADASLLDNSEINNQLDHIEANLKEAVTPTQAARDTAILFASKPAHTTIHPLLPAVDDTGFVTDSNQISHNKKTNALAQAALQHQSSFGSLSQISYHTLNHDQTGR